MADYEDDYGGGGDYDGGPDEYVTLVRAFTSYTSLHLQEPLCRTMKLYLDN